MTVEYFDSLSEEEKRNTVYRFKEINRWLGFLSIEDYRLILKWANE
mgnify:CR=1 FL=1